MPDIMRAFSGLSSAMISESIEGIAVFSFVAFAIIYFLAPVLGYAADSRGTLLMSLYALIGYGVLVLLQSVIIYFIYIVSSNNSDTGPKAIMHFNTIFGILKLLVFIVAQVAFVLGLQKLTRVSASRA